VVQIRKRKEIQMRASKEERRKTDLKTKIKKHERRR
jgi:hypothetical protein